MALRLLRLNASRTMRSASHVFPRPTPPAARCFATTNTGHAAKQSSDTAWQIGSALVFGPVVAYLLFGTGNSSAHASHSHGHTQLAAIEPVVEEVSDVQQASATYNAPAAEEPEPASAASEDGLIHGAPAMTDDEGTTASSEDIKESMDKAFKANIPEDARREEANQATDAEKGDGKPANSPSEDASIGKAHGHAASEEVSKEN